MGPLQVGATLSRKYRIERQLAENGGVILYEATDTHRARRVWIKILQREALENADALARFQREAGGAKVLDVGKNDDGLPYMVATDLATASEKPPVPRKRPAAPALKSSKATLVGVAPPPKLVLDEDDEPPPSSEIPLLGDADVLAEETPRPPEPAPAPARKAEPSPPVASPFASPFASPLVADDEPAVEEEVIVEDDEQLSAEARRRALEQTNPSIRVLDLLRREERRRRAAAWRWAVGLPLLVTFCTIAGWYIGHRQTAPAASVAPAVSSVQADPIVATSGPADTTPADTSTPAATATATATATVTATATATATATTPPAAPTMLATASTSVEPAPLVLPTARKPVPRHAKPAHRKPHGKPPPTSDPLTL